MSTLFSPPPEDIKPPLLEFAFIGSYPPGSLPGSGDKAIVENTLTQLKDLAMQEDWNYSVTPYRKPYPILHSYLFHTFSRIQEEGKILENDRHAAFNTGLVTVNQEEIFMVFRGSRDGKRAFKEFCKESSNELTRFDALPERAIYFTEPAD